MRFITIGDDGVVEISADNMDVPLTDFEAAVQRIVIAIFTTAGTIVDDPAWGGTINRLANKINRDLEGTISSIVNSATDSLLSSEPQNNPYRITNLTLRSIEKRARGVAITLRVEFAEATSEEITILGQGNVSF